MVGCDEKHCHFTLPHVPFKILERVATLHLLGAGPTTCSSFCSFSRLGCDILRNEGEYYLSFTI